MKGDVHQQVNPLNRCLRLFAVLIILAACRPAPRESALLPTLIPSPTPEGFDYEAASQVAASFLGAWQNGDFTTMHQLTTLATQEATPLEQFTQIYTSAHTEMTLTSLSIQFIADQMNEDVVELIYNVTFTTSILGVFQDTDRTLTLVADTRAGGWRVAWSPGDIFPEMGSGAALRLERSIPLRGNIRDATGEILADMNGRIVVVSLVPSQIPNREACIAVLPAALNLSAEVVGARLDLAGDEQLIELGTMEAQTYVQMQDQLERDCAAQFGSRPTRQYHNGSLAPHVIGTVSTPNEVQLPAVLTAGFAADSLVGQSGVERYWDSTLRGTAGGRLALFGRDGRRLRTLAEATSRPGQSVWLTIDYDLQQFTLQAIGEAYLENREDWAARAEGAAAVVLDVNTGAVLAMVSYPTYDLNAFVPYPAIGLAAARDQQAQVAADTRVPLLNRAAMGTFPAGSTFKIADTLAVLDSGVMTRETQYVCSGVWQREEEDNFLRFDWLEGGHNTVTPSDALAGSCNPFYYTVGFEMYQRDPTLMPRYARTFGFGVPTGLIDIDELPGVIPDPTTMQRFDGSPWTLSDAVNMSIGQGDVLVTPLQMARLVAAVANGGTLYRPQLVQQTGLIGEVPTYTLEADPNGLLGVSEMALTITREGMCRVTTDTNLGTATHIFRDSPLLDLGVCGKTGTAEENPDDPTHAWFVAYAPRENPQIAVVVFVENGNEGSNTAAPLVRRIMEYYFFGAG